MSRAQKMGKADVDDLLARLEAMPFGDGVRLLALLVGLSGPQEPADPEIMCLRSTPSPAAVRKLIKTGELPASKVGREFFFKRADFEAMLQKHRVVPKLKPAKLEPENGSEAALKRVYADRFVAKKRA